MAKYSATKLLKRSVVKRIHALTCLDLHRIPVDKLERQMRELLGAGYVSRPLLINAPDVYRARKNNETPFTNVKAELWWPEPKYVTKRGRCNEAGHPVFYCANSEDTAVIEMQPEVGDVLTVLKCSLVSANSQPMVMTVGIHDFIAKSNPRYGGTPPELDIAQQTFLQREGISETNPLLNSYLSKELVRKVAANDEDNYKATSTITKILLETPDLFNDDGTAAPSREIDGLAYPSIRTDKLGVNLALKTTVADILYKPESCVVYRVTEKRDKNHYEVGTLLQSTSIAFDGTITWDRWKE